VILTAIKVNYVLIISAQVKTFWGVNNPNLRKKPSDLPVLPIILVGVIFAIKNTIYVLHHVKVVEIVLVLCNIPVRERLLDLNNSIFVSHSIAVASTTTIAPLVNFALSLQIHLVVLFEFAPMPSVKEHWENFANPRPSHPNAKQGIVMKKRGVAVSFAIQTNTVQPLHSVVSQWFYKKSLM